MKITDELLMAHFDVVPEQIEYTVRDKTTRLYLKTNISTSFFNISLQVVFSPTNVYIYLVKKDFWAKLPDGKVLIDGFSIDEETSSLELVLRVKKYITNFSRALSDTCIYSETTI